jgi:hypothetical protein
MHQGPPTVVLPNFYEFRVLSLIPARNFFVFHLWDSNKIGRVVNDFFRKAIFSSLALLRYMMLMIPWTRRRNSILKIGQRLGRVIVRIYFDRPIVPAHGQFETCCVAEPCEPRRTASDSVQRTHGANIKIECIHGASHHPTPAPRHDQRPPRFRRRLRGDPAHQRVPVAFGARARE